MHRAELSVSAAATSLVQHTRAAAHGDKAGKDGRREDEVSTRSSIDYQNLLRKYIAHIQHHDSTNRIRSLAVMGTVPFSDDEWTELERLAGEAETSYPRQH